jgi:Tfp pilus assembly protein PilF
VDLLHGLARVAIVLAAVGCGGGASQMDADKSMKQYELAAGLRVEGDGPGAYKALFRALELDEKNVHAHLLLANMYLLDRDANGPAHDAEAEKAFKRVIELESDGDVDMGTVRTRNLKNDAINGLGVLYIHQRRHADALAVLREAAEDIKNPEAYMAWGNIGLAYYEMGDDVKAQETLERAVRLQAQFCVGFLRLGQVYLRDGKPEKAEEMFTAALEAHESCNTLQQAWHLRGEARMKLGNRTDARGDFEHCLELGQKSEAGQACQRYLEATY